jgi:VanZ family protein
MSRHRLFWPWFSLAGYALVIFSFSALPGQDVKPPFPWSDKLYHFLEYVPFGFLSLRAFFWQRGRALLPALLSAFFVVFLYSLSDEIHQLFVPGRTFDLLDAAVDIIGGGAGFLIYSLWRK